MPNTTKLLLEDINKMSRQILSRIQTVQKKTQENTLVTNESNKDESITEQTLTELMSKRENFIHLLFKKKTTEEIAQEITLVNEMVSLDSELTSSSQACKKILAGQILRLKQGKKVSKSYQKY